MSFRGALLGCLVLLLAACGAGGSAPPTLAATPALAPLAAQGAALFGGKGRCASCHALAPDTVIVGPSLAGIATRAATRVTGLDAPAYLEESILRPDAYKPPGFEAQQMLTTLAKELTLEEVEALVAYLLTLK